MSSDDCVDAFDKILRLGLKGKQDREVFRVIVDCCMQEGGYNPFYVLLAVKLCEYHKGHKFSLQYCLWDLMKTLGDMDLRKSANLARFTAHILGASALSLSCLKAVEFSDPKFMTPKAIVHMCIIFENLLLEFPEATVKTVFSRIATEPKLGEVREQIALFLETRVRNHALTVAEIGGGKKGALLVKRCKVARKALANAFSSMQN